MSTQPPTPEALIGTMQDMLIQDPEQNAVVFFGSEDGDVIMPCIEHPTDTLALLKRAVGLGVLSEPSWIAIVSDSYSITVPIEEMPAMKPGLLGELFAAGDPRVKESVMAFCLAPDGPSYCKQQRYTRVGDVFVWDDPEDLPQQHMSGAIANGMRRVLGMELVAS